MKDFGNKYDRLYVPIVTPFKDNTYEPDESQLRSFLRVFLQPKYVEAGIGIIINPEAGEIFYLSREEIRKNVEITVNEINGKVPVFAGVIANTTAGTVDVALDAKKAGVDGLFMIPPLGAIDVTIMWNSIKYPEVWLDMIKEVVKAVGDMPMICHPTVAPSPIYGIGLPLEPTIKICTEIKNIVGWKMTYSYEGYKIIAGALRKLDRHVGIFGAGSKFFHESLACDELDGTVSGSWNYAPEPMLDHINAWRKENLKEARQIWKNGLGQLQRYVGSDLSRLHVRYKIAAWLRGFISHPFMRPPIPKPQKEEIQSLRELLVSTGLNIIDDAKISGISKTLEV
jgi:dihydrodipicolinate synthase/N-acetylneuraminate lyase